MKFENLFWWQYKPTDEREQELYAKAYSRAFKTLVTLVFTGIVFLVSDDGFIPARYWGLYLFCSTLVAYLNGAIVLRNEELSLQAKDPESAIKTHKAIIPTVLLTYSAYIFVLFAWPQHFFVLTIFVLVLVRVLLSIGAYIATEHMEKYLRILFAFFLPLTALMLSRMKKRSAGSFAAALGLAVLLYGGFAIAPIALARSIIVMPIYVTTDTFAPDLKKNDYRLVDKTADAFVVGDYVVIKREGLLSIGRVTAVNNSEVTMQNANGEITVPKKEIIGRVINQTNWFTAFIESQMPKQ